MVCRMPNETATLFIYEIFYFSLYIDSNSLSKLQVLDLSGNNFNAQILESLAAFPTLKILDIRGNNLEGSYTTKGKLYNS